MDYEEIKRQILTDYFTNTQRIKRLKDKIHYICFKYYLSRNSKIAEDVFGEVQLALSKYNAEKLVTVVQKNPNNLEAIAYTIAVRNFRFKPQAPDNPNNSPGTKLLFASTYWDVAPINPLENELNDSDESNGFILYDGDLFSEFDYDSPRWDIVKARLTNREIAFLENLMSVGKKPESMTRTQFRQYKDYVFTKIQNMDISRPLTPLEVIYTKLDKEDLEKFDIIYDEDLSVQDKIKKLKVKSKWGYFYQRKQMQKKVARIRGAKDDTKTSE